MPVPPTELFSGAPLPAGSSTRFQDSTEPAAGDGARIKREVLKLLLSRPDVDGLAMRLSESAQAGRRVLRLGVSGV